jgi:hypothetical protein
VTEPGYLGYFKKSFYFLNLNTLNVYSSTINTKHLSKINNFLQKLIFLFKKCKKVRTSKFLFRLFLVKYPGFVKTNMFRNIQGICMSFLGS